MFRKAKNSMDKYYGHFLVLGQVEKFTIFIPLVDILLFISALSQQLDLKLMQHINFYIHIGEFS